MAIPYAAQKEVVRKTDAIRNSGKGQDDPVNAICDAINASAEVQDDDDLADIRADIEKEDEDDS